LDTLNDLSELSRYVTTIDLNSNEVLPWEDETHHGLFFIEYGQLRIEHNSDHYTTNKHTSAATSAAANSSVLTIGHLNARSAGAVLNAAHATTTTSIRGVGDLTEQNFRLARVGPGWVVFLCFYQVKIWLSETEFGSPHFRITCSRVESIIATK
jgi:hypothetical protein